MRRQPRSLEDCLIADAGVARLASHSWRLVRLQRILESVTPLTRRARVSNVKSGKIFIFADNSAVAAKLRQLEPRLVKILQAEAPEVTGIEIRVQPGRPLRPPAQFTPRSPIGSSGKHALTSLADRLPSGSALRAALKRLVDRS